MNKTILFVFIAFLAFSCKKGEKHANLPPEIKLAFESINLSGENRLNSTIQLSWFGTDKDGFVQGYEISFNNKNWYFVTTVDSTFQFPLEAGKDTTDIHFYVRSIDNLNEPDPTPAYL